MIAGKNSGPLAAGLCIILLSLPVVVQGAADDSFARAGLPSHAAVVDCSQARDPARCLAMRQARADCQGKRGSARRQCLLEHMPAPDCSQAPDPGSCQARQQGRQACRGKVGKEMRGCQRAYSLK